MNRIFFVFLVLIISISMLSCGGGGGDDDSPVGPQPQSAEITVSYSGTAKCSPFVTHSVRFEFVDVSTGKSIVIQKFDANPDMLKDGYTYTTRWEFDVGNYEVYTRWDWDDDLGKDSFEPIGQPNPASFTVDGYSTVELDIELQDVTSPNAQGRIEGTITYDGSRTGWHDLHIVLQDNNYKTITEDIVPGWLINDTKLSAGYHYNFTNVPPGTYCCDRVVAYWDVNENGFYDNEPLGRYLGPVYVSPGLPTVDIDILLVQ